MKKVLYIQPLHPSGMEYLKAKYEIAVAPSADKADIIEAARDASAIVTRLTRVDAEMMAACPKLMAVAKHGVGVDNIDVEYCKAHNIAVLTTGDANSSTVAEHTMLALGALYKRIPYLNAELRAGNWKARDTEGSRDLLGSVLGILGFGRIGRYLARMAARGFDMRVMVFDPYAKKSDVEAEGYEYFENLNDMLPLVDALSPHVPLTPATRGIIGDTEIAIMKRGSYILNFARGGVVDEKALIRALESGHIAGAAIDAYPAEPPELDATLVNHKNVILSPHCATFTAEARERMSMRVAQEIEKVLD